MTRIPGKVAQRLRARVPPIGVDCAEVKPCNHAHMHVQHLGTQGDDGWPHAGGVVHKGPGLLHSMQHPAAQQPGCVFGLVGAKKEHGLNETASLGCHTGCQAAQKQPVGRQCMHQAPAHGVGSRARAHCRDMTAAPVLIVIQWASGPLSRAFLYLLCEAGLEGSLLNHIQRRRLLLSQEVGKGACMAANDQHALTMALGTSCGCEAVGHGIQLSANCVLAQMQVGCCD